MRLSKYAKLVKEGGYCSVIHAEDSGIWLGTRAALFRATELPDMVGEEQVRTVLDIPEKAWEKVHLEEKWVDSVHDIFGLNLADFETGEQDTTKLKMLAAPDGLCRLEDPEDCKRVNLKGGGRMCERCIQSWLLRKAKVELAREERMKREDRKSG